MEKKNCFAYYNAKKPRCTALKELYCRHGECKFFKPWGKVSSTSISVSISKYASAYKSRHKQA